MRVSVGQVIAPSGTVVLACAGFVDEWAEVGEPLSVRAQRAAAAGGAHLRDWLAEAVAVPVGTGPVTVTALTRPGTYDAVDTIAVLEVDLGLPWSAVSTGTTPVVLGELPVDRNGMVLGDAVALDSWVGFVRQRPPVDGLADLMVWGKGDAQAWQHFDIPAIPTLRSGLWHGWLDLPHATALERKTEINRWAVSQGHYQYLASVFPHSHHHLGWRAGWQHPLGAGVIEVADCPILCFAWNPSELQRFTGGRPYGQVYPLTLEPAAGRAVLRWTIPPYEDTT
jgi:hypothetical protein